MFNWGLVTNISQTSIYSWSVALEYVVIKRSMCLNYGFLCCPASLPACLPCLCFSSEEGHRRNRQSRKLALRKEGFIFTVHSFHGAPCIGNAIYLIKTKTEWFLSKCYSKVDFFFSCLYLYICSTLFSK